MEHKQVPPPPSGLNDVGTRYSHLVEYRDSIEVCIKILEDRGLHALVDKERHRKFTTALEVISTTIDSFAGLKNQSSDYYLYRLIDTIPKEADKITGGRGTPLI